MLARTHLLRIQRSMYDRLKNYAREYLGGLGPELKRYFLEYQRDFQDFQDISSKRELLMDLERANLIFCGDYHTLSQAQRTVIRLLRDSLPNLKKRNKEVILALEMVRASDNPWIAKYLAGKLSEAEFLKKISFERNWGFSWDNYCGLFHFAKEKGLRVVGLNVGTRKRPPSLRERDRFAARVVCKLTHQYRTALVFVLMGDLHLAQAHLPKQVTRELTKIGLKRRSVVIHQNNERFYWKLVDRGLEHLVDVVKIKADVYCVMNTPPWVKLQSHLKWAEILVESNGEGTQSETDSPSFGKAFSEVDYSDEIRELIGTIAKFLRIDIDEVDDFSVYGPTNLNFLKNLESESLGTAREILALTAYVKTFKSQFIPRSHKIFLSTLNPNHAATASALYVHAKLSGFNAIFLSPKNDFYAFIWVEALGFVGSKIINHKRKCNGPGDLKNLVNAAPERNTATKENQRLAKFVLAHWDREAECLRGTRRTLSGILLPQGPLRPDRTVFYYKATKLIGQLLGNALYTAVVEDRISRDDLRALFHTPFDRLTRLEARDLYMDWVRQLDGFGYRYFTKSEKL